MPEETDIVQDLLHLKALYGLTTRLTSKCFQACLGERADLRKLDLEHRQCLAACTVNHLQVRLLVTNLLVQRNSANVFHSKEDGSTTSKVQETEETKPTTFAQNVPLAELAD
jgi:hypothetical protein